MNELELLVQLQTILNKLENSEALTDHEYKLFSSVIFGVAMGVLEKSLSYVLSLFSEEGDKNE